jgi:Protein of unknown function (DUF3987)
VQMAHKSKKPSTRKSKPGLFSDLKVQDGNRKRPLTEKEKRDLTAMLAVKERPEALDIQPLVPQGSYIQRMLNHFKATDTSYALPLFQLIMIASSWLTQNGATLSIPGMKPHRPILWIIALAASGSSKTLATNRVKDTLTGDDEVSPVRMFPKGSTDAQWIIDLKDNNGSYWFQDEVGQFFKSVLTQSNYARIKPWMLDAYSHEEISNRLKSEENKLTIKDPHFTFLGLTVRETWKMNIDLPSMLDGLCQRFNYVVAEKRTDTDMFDHFLFFRGEQNDIEQEALREMWHALCHQENSCGVYNLAPETHPFIESWWSGLRPAWGNSALPESFIRRIGFSVLAYLVVIHFLLGRSRKKVDVETARIATHFAEYHMECALVMIREYDTGWSDRIRIVANRRQRHMEKTGNAPTAREIQKNLSSKARQILNSNQIKEIMTLLENLESSNSLPLFDGENDPISDRIFTQHMANKNHEDTQEYWRNKKRLAKVLEDYRSAEMKPPSPSTNIVDFKMPTDVQIENPLVEGVG